MDRKMLLTSSLCVRLNSTNVQNLVSNSFRKCYAHTHTHTNIYIYIYIYIYVSKCMTVRGIKIIH